METPERWYYDACALDWKKSSYGEMTSKQHPISPVVSHLALGEAYGNSRRKGLEDEFLHLMRAAGKFMDVVGNDSIDDILEKIRAEFPIPLLSITDAMHLATALKHHCHIFKTTDPDFFRLDQRKVRDIADSLGIPNFTISLA